jgi:hypothetical protein
MADTILQPTAQRVGTFDGGKIAIAQDGDTANFTLVMDVVDKGLSPDVAINVWTEDAKGNRKLLTSGRVTPGPWIDKNGKPQLFGADPSFQLNGVKGLTLAVDATLSKPVTCSVTTDAKADAIQPVGKV